jgi:hypothetical protein
MSVSFRAFVGAYLPNASLQRRPVISRDIVLQDIKAEFAKKIIIFRMLCLLLQMIWQPIPQHQASGASMMQQAG